MLFTEGIASGTFKDFEFKDVNRTGQGVTLEEKYYGGMFSTGDFYSDYAKEIEEISGFITGIDSILTASHNNFSFANFG